ncbi:LysM domain-containing protein [Streptomyces sp. TverLS-915]|uniref:GH25 family lysozyme n=1 Tax=Streptomyces sp. TverLS-915 TaxID=1839763 RepID=UPI00081D6B36|nr:GH25 family lysozyme [Streptomyces sp. TverLS-915]SCD36946.1 LysM domain-containing protein [Streptomyces sp. TverLS-915]
MITGQDWASYQPASPSTSGLDFALIKATEGTSYTNPRMASQAATARAAGLVTGFYHFLLPGNVQAQAEYFVRQAASVEYDLLVCDWESSAHGSPSCAEKDQFLKAVQKLRGSNHRVLLYCNRDFWTNRDTTSFAADGLWIAEYNGKPGKPSIKAPWVIHQYTSAPVDTNVAAFGSRAELRAWARAGAGDDGQEHEAAKPPAKPKPAPAPKPAASTYRVRAGDTLSGIAVRFGTTVSKLAALNGIKDADRISVGQVLKLTGSAPAAKSTTYRVRAGDTLSGIAAAHGTTVAKLAKANNLKNPDVIRVGQTLKIVK